MNTLYGYKQKQSQDYDSKGHRVPLTWVKIEPATVVGQRTNKKNGYDAMQITLGNKKHPNKPLQGLLKNISKELTPQYIREIKSDQLKTVGEKIIVADVFSAGDKIHVTGKTIGKGFAGVVKRHGFHGGPKTHGQSTKQRHPGSIGQTTTPGRVYKGKRMAGHMGNVTATVKNLEVFSINSEQNMLAVKGLIPGHFGSLVKITKI